MTIAAIVTLVGALVYGLVPGQKLQELGRIMFFVGLLWLVHALGNGRITF